MEARSRPRARHTRRRYGPLLLQPDEVQGQTRGAGSSLPVWTLSCSRDGAGACASTPRAGPISREVQRILAEVHGVSEQQRSTPRRVRIVSVEAVAEKWLLPRLASFKAAHPDIAIELETNHRSVDPARRDFDAWLAYSGETSAPRPLTRREETLLEEALYEEALLPVCSPALRGRPRPAPQPAQLRDWPLLYDLGWNADWSYWFARQGQPTPDLSRASGFRLYSMLIQAAASGLGAAIGRPMLIAHELERRILVPLFERQQEAPERCCLITTAASRQRPELRAFRAWILREAALPPPTAPGVPRYA